MDPICDPGLPFGPDIANGPLWGDLDRDDIRLVLFEQSVDFVGCLALGEVDKFEKVHGAVLGPDPPLQILRGDIGWPVWNIVALSPDSRRECLAVFIVHGYYLHSFEHVFEL